MYYGKKTRQSQVNLNTLDVVQHGVLPRGRLDLAVQQTAIAQLSRLSRTPHLVSQRTREGFLDILEVDVYYPGLPSRLATGNLSDGELRLLEALLLANLLQSLEDTVLGLWFTDLGHLLVQEVELLQQRNVLPGQGEFIVQEHRLVVLHNDGVIQALNAKVEVGFVLSLALLQFGVELLLSLVY